MPVKPSWRYSLTSTLGGICSVGTSSSVLAPESSVNASLIATSVPITPEPSSLRLTDSS